MHGIKDGRTGVASAKLERTAVPADTDSEIQLRSRLAFNPFARATAAVDTPGWRAAINTCTLKAAL